MTTTTMTTVIITHNVVALVNISWSCRKVWSNTGLPVVLKFVIFLKLSWNQKLSWNF